MQARALAAILALQLVVAHAAEDLAVSVARQGERFSVRASASIAVPAATVWEVLTDYESLPRFIPGLSSSTVQLRAGQRVVVEQKGEARFLFFSFPIEVRLEVLESPAAWISSRSVGGNLRRMTGRYDVETSVRGSVLRYSGELEPGFDLPPVIGALAVRIMAEQQFAALVAEIERRASLHR
jgi:carbon monoxide dehydrogenase subunit G